MRVDPDLARLRRRLLRRYLHDAGLDPGDVAEAIGVSVEYLQKMLAGSRVISDGVAWRLYVTIGLPVHILEAWPPRRALPPQPYENLLKEVLTWRHNGLVSRPQSADKKPIHTYR